MKIDTYTLHKYLVSDIFFRTSASASRKPYGRINLKKNRKDKKKRDKEKRSGIQRRRIKGQDTLCLYKKGEYPCKYPALGSRRISPSPPVARTRRNILKLVKRKEKQRAEIRRRTEIK